jgi:glycosyltransferase 2 family protein
VAGVVWWALRQEPPQLPDAPGEWAALLAAVALYGLATLVRGERWHALLREDGAHPVRADAHGLNVVGYMGNNILPARAGDAMRIFLMAPRALSSRRTVAGTLIAERLLDVAVILILFVVVGYGLLGEIGAGSVGWIALATGVAVAAAALGVFLVRRNERLHRALEPVLSAPLGLRGRHGLILFAATFLIWGIEAAVWMLVGHAAGVPLDPIEGCYLVALASVFALIPSGPGYAGTQDAAAIIGLKALGGTGAQAVAYLLLLRFVIVVPITIAGLVLMATRYGGLRRLRGAPTA